MPATYLGTVETGDGADAARLHRFELLVDAQTVDDAATEARARIAAGQSPPRTLAAAAHAIAAEIIDAALSAGLGS